MDFNGFFNSGGTGTVLVVGGANENIPAFTELVCSNEKMFFSGQFTNLSRQLIHITIQGFGTAAQFHKHDLREIQCSNQRLERGDQDNSVFKENPVFKEKPVFKDKY